MALHDDSDGCSPGLCNCGCQTNPCQPCPTPTTITTAVTAAGTTVEWAWCIAVSGGRTVCWPYETTIPTAALQWAGAHQTTNPIPMAVADRSSVDWP